MRIKQISVSKLFGMFDHTVLLNTEDRITIMHGPNGYGKTALLKLINALFSKSYSVLRTIPFDAFYINYEDGSKLTISQTYQKEMFPSEDNPPKPSLAFEWATLAGDIERQLLEPTSAWESREFDDYMDVIEMAIPDLERVGARSWQYLPTGEIMGMHGIIERFGENMPLPPMRYRNAKVSEWLERHIGSTSVHFIQAERLLKIHRDDKPRRLEKSPHFSFAVEVYSDELANFIKTALAESAALSQSLDRTFPRRLIEFPKKDTISEKELRKRLEKIEKQRSRLMDAGLLEQEQETAFQIPLQLEQHTQRVLSVYVRDTEKKLSVFDELAQKIELMQGIINRHFHYKDLAVNKEHGFVFRTTEGKRLLPTDLSSGEQHQMVMVYELLFKVDKDALVLIDEPEISLHVAWQLRFLKDLESIINLVPFDALIATHSPQIINDRWDLTVKLEESSRWSRG